MIIDEDHYASLSLQQRAEVREQIAALFYDRCAICDTVMEKPQLDHDHNTGHVRGVLCRSCNWGLGHFKDDPRLLRNAYLYLIGETDLAEPTTVTYTPSLVIRKRRKRGDWRAHL